MVALLKYKENRSLSYYISVNFNFIFKQNFNVNEKSSKYSS